MKLYKEVNIDLDKYRSRIKDKNCGYSKREKEKLTALYCQIESGDFRGAYEYAAAWTRSQRELIPCDIWDILLNVCMGIEYKL